MMTEKSQQAVVQQKPTKEFPDEEIAVNELNYEFESVFNTLFPDVHCSHCYAQFRLLFIAGMQTADNFYDALEKIRDEKAKAQLFRWWLGQVNAGKQELEVELKVAKAANDYCLHETTGHH